MKHFLLTLIALCGISYAFAETHTVYLYDDKDDPQFASITIVDEYGDPVALVDDANNPVDIPFGYAKATVEDGAVLTFTLTDPNQVVFMYGLPDYDELGMGLTFTINESTPEEVEFAPGDPYGVIELKVANACNIITKIKIGTMDMAVDESYCKTHEDGYNYIRIPYLNEGDVVVLTSSEDVDWGEYGGVGKTGTIPYNQEVTATSKPILIIATDVWDDNDPEDYTSIDIPQSLTITYVGRTIYANMWNPICFPFNITQAKMEEIFGANTVVNFESATFSTSGLTVECSYVTNGMKANTPYLVNPKTDITGNMKFEDVYVQNFEVEPKGDDVKFIGTVSPIVLSADDKTKLFIGKSNVVYYPAEDVEIKGFRGYFEIPAGMLAQGRKPGAARFIIRDRKAPTGIEDNVMNGNNAAKYIQNGRLVIENNGVRYNAQGQQID